MPLLYLTKIHNSNYETPPPKSIAKHFTTVLLNFTEAIIAFCIKVPHCIEADLYFKVSFHFISNILGKAYSTY